MVLIKICVFIFALTVLSKYEILSLILRTLLILLEEGDWLRYQIIMYLTSEVKDYSRYIKFQLHVDFSFAFENVLSFIFKFSKIAVNIVLFLLTYAEFRC